MTLYETDEDRANQRRVADALAAHWRCGVMKMPERHAVDYLFGDDNGAMWIEIKKRNVTSTKYKTLMIDKKKLEAGLAHSDGTGFPFGLVVHWNDGVFFVRVDNLHRYFIDLGGRADRADANDTDIVVHIPTSEFRRLL